MSTTPSLRLLERYGRQAAALREYYGLTHREMLLEQAMEFLAINGVPGDCLEFGVYAGASFIHAYWAHRVCIDLHSLPVPGLALTTQRMLQRPRFLQGQQAFRAKRFVAFDSFQGLPATANTEDHVLGEGDYACSREDFMRNLSENQVDLACVEVVEGWFEDTLNPATRDRLGLTQAALIHIDCDLYESTRDVLAFVTDVMVDGTVVIFDDWDLYNGRPDRGQQKAFHQWRALHPDVSMAPFKTHNSFIVHR
jgi:hypothetical protein